MSKKCPLCEGELQEVEGNLYCPKDDVTFTQNKGKMIVDPDNKSKGKIQELEEELAEHGMKLDKVIERLFGDKDEDLW